MKHTKNKSDTDIEIFSPSEKDQILQNIFFSGKAVDGSFLYRGEEATQLYEALIHDPAYFPYQSSLNLIKKHLHQLQPYIKGKLIDYGSGTGEKAAALLQNIHKKVQYIPYDYSYKMTELARATVKNNPFISTDEGIIIKGTGEEVSLIKDATDKTILFLGGTSANFDFYSNVHKLRSMGNSSRTQGNFVFWDYFTAPTEEELFHHLLPAYDNLTQKARFEHGLEMLGLNLEDFSFAVEYVKDTQDGIIECGKRVFPGEIQAGFKAEKDVQLSLTNGKVITIPAGSFYPLNTSRRRSEAEVKKIFHEAGARKVDEVTELGMKTAVLKFSPSKLTQHQVQIRNALLAVLLLSVGRGAKSVYDVKVQRDREEQAKYIQYNQREFFSNLTGEEQALQYFQSMYGKIPSDHFGEFTALLESALAREMSSGVITIGDTKVNWGNGGIYAFLLKFSKENAILLSKWGISVTTPYENITKRLPNIEKTLALQENLNLGEFLQKRPADPMVDPNVPNMQEVVRRYGNRSPEFEQALAKRQKAIAEYEAYQKLRDERHPQISLGSYCASDGTVYYFIQLKGGLILASTTEKGEDGPWTNYSSDATKRAMQDYFAHFGEGETLFAKK